MIIFYYCKITYGTKRYYCVEQHHSQAFMVLTGNKTITTLQMKALSLLGLVFEEVTESKAMKMRGEKND